jgi:Ulp1 family protease
MQAVNVGIEFILREEFSRAEVARDTFSYTTFFYFQYTDPLWGYKGVQRQTQHVDIFSMRTAFIPIHVKGGDHW